LAGGGTARVEWDGDGTTCAGGGGAGRATGSLGMTGWSAAATGGARPGAAGGAATAAPPGVGRAVGSGTAAALPAGLADAAAAPLDFAVAAGLRLALAFGAGLARDFFRAETSVTVSRTDGAAGAIAAVPRSVSEMLAAGSAFSVCGADTAGPAITSRPATASGQPARGGLRRAKERFLCAGRIMVPVDIYSVDKIDES
jgi:hypothetical protein